MLSLVLVLAVTGSAAGSILENAFGVPAAIGICIMLIAVVVLNYYGRQLVEKTLTLWGLSMSLVLVVYAVMAISVAGDSISEAFHNHEVSSGWWKSGVQFFLYNIFILPVLLYATDHIQTRRQAWGAGAIGGILGVFPGIIFHVTFMSGYPSIIDQELPTYWTLQQLNLPILLAVYVVMLFGTIVQTGVGILQGINERMDHWWEERTGRKLNPKVHASLAGAAVLISMLLANLGIVTLVAKGYGSLAWFSAAIYVLPVLTIGLYKLIVARKKTIV